MEFRERKLTAASRRTQRPQRKAKKNEGSPTSRWQIATLFALSALFVSAFAVCYSASLRRVAGYDKKPVPRVVRDGCRDARSGDQDKAGFLSNGNGGVS